MRERIIGIDFSFPIGIYMDEFIMDKKPASDFGCVPTTSGRCSAVGVSEPQWFIAIVKNNTELSVRDKLQKHGIESYVPTQLKLIILPSGRKKDKVQVVIPSIIFINCSEEQRRKEIVGLPYIHRFMINNSGTPNRFNRRPLAIVPNDQIEKLKFMVGNTDESIEFRPLGVKLGDTVEIVRGGLKGLIGNVENTNNATWFLIRIDTLGYASVKIDPVNLRAINIKE